MRIYLDKGHLQYIGWGNFPRVRGDYLRLIAKREPMVCSVIGGEPERIDMETKGFEIQKVANGCSVMSGVHRAIILKDEKDIEKYFSKIDKA